MLDNTMGPEKTSNWRVTFPVVKSFITWWLSFLSNEWPRIIAIRLHLTSGFRKFISNHSNKITKKRINLRIAK